MDIRLHTTPLHLTLHGFGATAVNKQYVATAFQLSGKVWETIKAAGIKNKGQNIWVYDQSDFVFAGVELDHTENDHGLQKKVIHLEKYASYLHTGPYRLIRETTMQVIDQLSHQGFQVAFPNLEVYGHHGPDETKLQTQLIFALK